MAERSAGLLVWRSTPEGVEVLLAHPGGPFWAKRDDGAWTIPKGLIDADEDSLAAAHREFFEETCLAVDGVFNPLTPLRQPSRKVIEAYAVEADPPLDGFSSNSFILEWPPRSGRMATFPEIDRIAWFGLSKAAVKLLPGQRPFLGEVAALAAT